MPITPAEVPSFPLNPVTAYLRGLQRTKTGLPHGQLVCVSAAPTVTTTEALLQLAASVGPHIAILQIHADIIDDWSSKTVRELTLLAKKHRFVLWEGGRILNSSTEVLGTLQPQSRERRREDVNAVRRSYTRGVVSIASWAGLATSLASAVPAQRQDSDILIPVLKGAARETVAKIAQIIRTEITAETPPEEDQDSDDADAATHLSPVDIPVRTGLEPPARRASTISLTHSITQHSEPSSLLSTRDERRQVDDNAVVEGDLQYTGWPDFLSPPPLLARGLVLFLPSVTNFAFTPAYRDSCLAAARANPDFVVGFLCNEPWTIVSQISDILCVSSTTTGGDKRDELSPGDEAREESFIIFSPLPTDAGPFKVPRYGDNLSAGGGAHTRSASTIDAIAAASGLTLPDGLSIQASLLHVAIARAIASGGDAGPSDTGRDREGTSPDRGLLHIPIVTLGL
jgi:hypothetical protein